MKIFGKIKQLVKDGYESKICFFGVPIIKRVRDPNTKRVCSVYLLGIEVYHRQLSQGQTINYPRDNVIYDDSMRCAAGIMNGALERNLREIRLFEKEARSRLDKIEKQLKQIGQQRI